MKYICSGYLDVQNWEKKSPSEQGAMIDQCFAYDEVLKKNGHWAGGDRNQPPERTWEGPMSAIAGLVAIAASFIFGLLGFTPWVIIFQAIGLAISCIPFSKPPSGAAKPLLGFMAISMVGFMFQGGIAYVVGRGLRSLFA